MSRIHVVNISGVQSITANTGLTNSAIYIDETNNYVGIGKAPTVPFDINGRIDADNFIGVVAYHAANTPPEGWLECDGSTISRSTYSKLFAKIGTTFGAGDGVTTFKIPDLRGEFIRGWDNSRGIDSGRAFGSAQSGAIESHTHTGTTSSNGNHSHTWGNFITNDSATGSANKVNGNGSDGTTSTAGAHTHTFTTDATGGTETRPRNIALLPCIKY